MLDKRLVETVGRILGVDAASITPETSHVNTLAWDSVAHLNLILEVEAVFNIRFEVEEIPELTSVGRIQQALEERRAV